MTAVDKIFDFTRNRSLKIAEDAIKKVIKQKRLVYLSNGRAIYTDKHGEKTECNIDQLAVKILDITGQRDNFAQIGLGASDIANIILKYKGTK